MFGFAFALVPLYDLLCEVTGLGGRTNETAYTYDPAQSAPDKSRLIKVNFITNTNAEMPWEFEPVIGGTRVHPGEARSVMFRVKNPTNAPMIGQAVPSVVPGLSAQYFHKTECFCFEQQLLQPGESLDMPMRFVVDPDLPKHVTSISLAYTMFDVTERMGLPEAPAHSQAEADPMSAVVAAVVDTAAATAAAAL